MSNVTCEECKNCTAIYKLGLCETCFSNLMYEETDGEVFELMSEEAEIKESNNSVTYIGNIDGGKLTATSIYSSRLASIDTRQFAIDFEKINDFDSVVLLLQSIFANTTITPYFNDFEKIEHLLKEVK